MFVGSGGDHCVISLRWRRPNSPTAAHHCPTGISSDVAGHLPWLCSSAARIERGTESVPRVIFEAEQSQ